MSVYLFYVNSNGNNNGDCNVDYHAMMLEHDNYWLTLSADFIDLLIRFKILLDYPKIWNALSLIKSKGCVS